MLDVLDDDNVLGFVDSVQHAPLGAQSGAMELGQAVPERLAESVGRLRERPGDELDEPFLRLNRL